MPNTDDLRLSADDIREYSQYLRQCTDAQVQGYFDKEHTAGRDAYVALVKLEADRRELELCKVLRRVGDG